MDKPTEAQITTRMLKYLSRTVGKNVNICTELDGVLCRPDIATFSTPQFPSEFNAAAFTDTRFTPATANILEKLQIEGHPLKLTQLLVKTGYTKPYLNKRLREAAQLGLITWEHGVAHLTAPLDHTISKITSYEVKLSNWRRAIHQANSYKTFSHQTYIAMPATGIQRALAKAEAILRNNGIGLLEIQTDGTLETALPAADHTPRTYRYYYLALCNALRQKDLRAA